MLKPAGSHFCLRTAVTFLLLVLTTSAKCGELLQRNFNLPGIDKPVPQQQEKTVPEAVYEDFKKETRGLTPEKRKELIKTFTQKRDDALKGKRGDEAVYYSRLIDILNAQNQ